MYTKITRAEMTDRPFPQKSNVVLNIVLWCSVNTGLFLSGVLDVSAWHVWALCVTLYSQYVSLHDYFASADASLILPSETGCCSNPTVALQSFPALQKKTGVLTLSGQKRAPQCSRKFPLGL